MVIIIFILLYYIYYDLLTILHSDIHICNYYLLQLLLVFNIM